MSYAHVLLALMSATKRFLPSGEPMMPLGLRQIRGHAFEGLAIGERKYTCSPSCGRSL